jgi:hypothetical protein
VSKAYAIIFLSTLFGIGTLCAGCSAPTVPEQGNHARSIPDGVVGKDLLLAAVAKWAAVNSATVHAQSTVTTSPDGAGTAFRVDVAVRGTDGSSGEVEINLTRPTITQSKGDCGDPSAHQCKVERIENYTVQSTAGSSRDADNRQFSIEVDDSGNNLLALTFDFGGTGRPVSSAAPESPIVSRDQAVALSVACVNSLS